MRLIPKFEGGLLDLDPETIVSARPGHAGGTELIVKGLGTVWLAAEYGDVAGYLGLNDYRGGL